MTKEILEKIECHAHANSLDIRNGTIRRSSSRFCLGVEHGDYNGTELFGVGMDRFIWLAYKPNSTNKVRIASVNFPEDGVIEFETGKTPPPCHIKDSWARFPYGVDYILRKNGYDIKRGYDAVLFGNIPGGGMSRSASLTLNLILTLLEVNNIQIKDQFKIIDLAVAVENEYIGSPCGELDQIMILFAKEGMATHYNPKNRQINYVPLGHNTTDFRIVSLDTGTVRPGLEKSTYKIRRCECDQLVALAKEEGFKITCLADIKEQSLLDQILSKFQLTHPHLCSRLIYIYNAQNRFYKLIDAWKRGDIETVGAIFRQDGISLRDDYQISGPELETMCDIARSVEGVLGERMLGGGDKGAAGAIVKADSIDKLEAAVRTAYPRSRPHLSNKFAIHSCKVVGGIKVFDNVL